MMDIRHLMPSGMTIDELHSKVGGNRAYLRDVLAGWYKSPGIKLVLKICKECPKIKPSILRPELKGLK